MPIGSTGLLIIRAYLETESPAPLRAKIRLTSDVSAGIERTLTLVDVDRVAEVVRSWLVKDVLKTQSAAATKTSRLEIESKRWNDFSLEELARRFRDLLPHLRSDQ